MRKIVLLLCFGLLSLIGFAQYPPILNNTEWYVATWCPFVGYAPVSIYPLNDTTINSVTYKHYTASSDPTYFHYFLREDTLQKTVWSYHDSYEELLYNFNLTIGAELGEHRLVMIDTITTCAGERKRYWFDTIPGYNSYYAAYEVIEGIGSTSNPIGRYNYNSQFPLDVCGNALICSYQNDTANYINDELSIDCPNANGCSIITSINDNSKFTYQIYPNPTTSTLTIQNASGLYHLSDITGKTLLSGLASGETFTLDISTLSSGVYFLTLSEGGQQVVRKVAKQ